MTHRTNIKSICCIITTTVDEMETVYTNLSGLRQGKADECPACLINAADGHLVYNEQRIGDRPLF